MDTELTPLGNEPAFEGGLEQIEPGIWAWIQPNGELGESNAGLVVGEGESLLIDTLWDEGLTRRMLDRMREARAGAPISRLFNTHGDGDHWYGNGLLGGVEIVATEAAAGQMREEPPATLSRMRPLPKLAGAVSRIPFVPRRGGMRGLERFGKALAAYDFEGADPRLPDRTFAGSESLRVGGRQVDLIEVGPAHTPGDAIAWVPEDRVVFAGDIVFAGVTPIMWTGPVENWIAALESIAGLDPVKIVGGHGPVAGPECLAELIDYWTYLARCVPAGAGAAIDVLADEVVRGAEYRTSPWGEWRAPERTLINLAMIARARDGVHGELSIPDKIRLLSRMGDFRIRLEADGLV